MFDRLVEGMAVDSQSPLLGIIIIYLPSVVQEGMPIMPCSKLFPFSWR